MIARIHEAAKYVPLDRLYLSPQCGFASCEIGNKLTEEEQWAKQKHVASDRARARMCQGTFFFIYRNIDMENKSVI